MSSKIICGVCKNDQFKLEVTGFYSGQGIRLLRDGATSLITPVVREWKDDISGGAFYGNYVYQLGASLQAVREYFICVKCNIHYEYSAGKFNGSWHYRRDDFYKQGYVEFVTDKDGIIALPCVVGSSETKLLKAWFSKIRKELNKK